MCYIRYGVVKFESVMALKNKLEELGKMDGVNAKEKGLLNENVKRGKSQ